MITSPVAMFGLSDAGAHCGQICDGSMTTTYLSMWARDFGTGRLPASRVVHQLTRRPAAHFGWLAGVCRTRLLADLNVIDLEPLSVRPRRSPPICPPAVAVSQAGRATGGR